MSEMLRRIAGMMGKGGTGYATWNPADKGTGIALSGGNLIATSTGAGSTVRATVGKSSGKWYWEIILGGSGYWFLGVANSTQSLASSMTNPNASGVQSNDYYWNSVTNGAGTGYNLVAGDVIGFALDATAKTLAVYQNNVLLITISSVQSGTVYPAVSSYSGTEVFTANFGASALTYSPPSGYNPGIY